MCSEMQDMEIGRALLQLIGLMHLYALVSANTVAFHVQRSCLTSDVVACSK